MKTFKIFATVALTLGLLLFYLLLAWLSGGLAVAFVLLIAFAFSAIVVEVSHQVSKEDLYDETRMTDEEIQEEMEMIQNLNVREFTPIKAERLNILRKELFYKRIQTNGTNQVA